MFSFGTSKERGGEDILLDRYIQDIESDDVWLLPFPLHRFKGLVCLALLLAFGVNVDDRIPLNNVELNSSFGQHLKRTFSLLDLLGSRIVE